MENNSIKENLNKDDMISDILLSMGADINKENIYLIVEGESDVKFLQSFLSNNVLLYKSYGGKIGVETIVENFKKNLEVIGIRDRDYQMTTTSSKIFYYDYSCMEMMILKNDEVFKKICSEYYEGETSFLQLRSKILKELKYLSIVRMYNEKENWEKRIKGISMNSAWNSIEGKINNEFILEKLNEINEGFFKDEILSKIELEYERKWSDDEFYNNTQGHDFYMLYTTICNQFKSSKKIDYSGIEASNRCCFREKDFIQTNLYQKLSEYEKQNCFKICDI